MKTLKFKHNEKNITIKGEWDKDTFTAQAFAGKKEMSAPYSVTKEPPKDGMLADDSFLEDAAMNAAKNDVESGEFLAQMAQIDG